jgi:hypothetical protein
MNLLRHLFEAALFAQTLHMGQKRAIKKSGFGERAGCGTVLTPIVSRLTPKAKGRTCDNIISTLLKENFLMAI